MIKRLARCIREYKWATIMSPLCMVGEVAMEVLIPLVMANLYDYGIVMQDMQVVIVKSVQLVLCALMSLTFGFLPQTHTGKLGGQVQPLAASAIAVFTMRSSREWKVMIASLPPGFSRSIASSKTRSTLPSSSLTAIRMAWKLRFAGCCFSRSAAAGMAERIMSTSSKVV